LIVANGIEDHDEFVELVTHHLKAN